MHVCPPACILWICLSSFLSFAWDPEVTATMRRIIAALLGCLLVGCVTICLLACMMLHLRPPLTGWPDVFRTSARRSNTLKLLTRCFEQQTSLQPLMEIQSATLGWDWLSQASSSMRALPQTPTTLQALYVTPTCTACFIAALAGLVGCRRTPSLLLTTQHNTTQHNTIQHNTTQHNTTQHNTTQHNTTQHKQTHTQTHTHAHTHTRTGNGGSTQ